MLDVASPPVRNLRRRAATDTTSASIAADSAQSELAMEWLGVRLSSLEAPTSNILGCRENQVAHLHRPSLHRPAERGHPRVGCQPRPWRHDASHPLKVRTASASASATNEPARARSLGFATTTTVRWAFTWLPINPIDLIGIISYALGVPRSRKVDPVEIATRLAPALRWPGAPEGDERSWRLVALTPEFDAWVIAWPSGGRVDLHDHGNSCGALVVLEGTLVETIPWRHDTGRLSLERHELERGTTATTSPRSRARRHE